MTSLIPIRRTTNTNEHKTDPNAVNSWNRKQDKKRVESELGWSSGYSNIEVGNEESQIIAKGYERIVYGDHGPYLSSVLEDSGRRP